jgi:peptidoglycan/LPS O-acetylase OafA/YrhL
MRRLSQSLLSHLSRVTSSGQFVPEIDGLRFVAIFSVLLFHLHGYVFGYTAAGLPQQGLARATSDLMLKGWFGVQLFFVISGFILSLPWAEHHLLQGRRPSLGKYFVRRVTRLEPTYIISLLLAYAVLVYLCGAPAGSLAPNFFASLCYGHNILYGHGSAINEVAWSLEIEVQFYILAPLLCLVFRVRPAWLRRAVLAAAILLGCFQTRFYAELPLLQAIGFQSAVTGLTLIGQIKWFLVGFLLSDLYLMDWGKKPVKRYRWDLVGLAGWAMMPLFISGPYAGDLYSDLLGGCLPGGWNGPDLIVNLMHFAMPACMLLAYIGAFRGRLMNRLFVYPTFTVIGGMCYTIYLYHNFAYGLANAHLGGPLKSLGGPWLLAVGMVLSVLTFSAVLFVLFERPFMKKDWPRRLAGFFLPRRPAVLQEVTVVSGQQSAVSDQPSAISGQHPAIRDQRSVVADR